jgi:hypothetical protein
VERPGAILRNEALEESDPAVRSPGAGA